MPPDNYTLRVRFDNSQLRLLVEAGYKLCLAKLFNGNYNVVWFSLGNLANENIFEWTEEYQVFSARNFVNGAPIEVMSNATDITVGQTVVLGKDGVMQAATGPISGESFKVTNQYMPSYFGVSQRLGRELHPVFVQPRYTIVGSSENFATTSMVMLFFSKTMGSGTMFTEIDSASIEVSIMGRETQVVSYITDPSSPGGVSGVWVFGPPPPASPLLAEHKTEESFLEPKSEAELESEPSTPEEQV